MGKKISLFLIAIFASLALAGSVSAQIAPSLPGGPLDPPGANQPTVPATNSGPNLPPAASYPPLPGGGFDDQATPTPTPTSVPDDNGGGDRNDGGSSSSNGGGSGSSSNSSSSSSDSGVGGAVLGLSDTSGEKVNLFAILGVICLASGSILIEPRLLLKRAK